MRALPSGSINPELGQLVTAGSDRLVSMGESAIRMSCSAIDRINPGFDGADACAAATLLSIAIVQETSLPQDAIRLFGSTIVKATGFDVFF